MTPDDQLSLTGPRCQRRPDNLLPRSRLYHVSRLRQASLRGPRCFSPASCHLPSRILQHPSTYQSPPRMHHSFQPGTGCSNPTPVPRTCYYAANSSGLSSNQDEVRPSARPTSLQSFKKACYSLTAGEPGCHSTNLECLPSWLHNGGTSSH